MDSAQKSADSKVRKGKQSYRYRTSETRASITGFNLEPLIIIDLLTSQTSLTFWRRVSYISLFRIGQSMFRYLHYLY